MATRRRADRPRFLPRATSTTLRAAITGVAIGICIGALLGGPHPDEEEDEHRARRRPTEGAQSKLPLEEEARSVEFHEALRYGWPSRANVRVRAGYVVSYDFRTRNPLWVLEHLTKESLESADDADRGKSAFKVDSDVPELFRVHPQDFSKSGFDKGHLVPARDMAHSQDAMDESFLMTNISPQVGAGFNRGYWSRFEGFIRHLAHRFDGVYVVTGPLFLPTRDATTGDYYVTYRVLGTPPDGIAVPTHFFKVILARKKDGTFASAGFVLPNQPIPDKTNLLDFLTPIRAIEKGSGLVFFDKLEPTEIGELCQETQCALARSNWASAKTASKTRKST